MCLIRDFMEAFWDPAYWLPPNITWKDIEARTDIVYPDHRELAIPVVAAVFTLIVRWLLEKHVISRIGLRLGVKTRRLKRVPKNSTLEKAYIQEKRLVKPAQVTALSKQLDWTERQVERWLRLRRAQDKPTVLSKFSESFWRFMYYTGAFLLGLNVLWDKPWLWDMHACWTNFPFATLTDDVWWYYMISMTYYWSVMFSHYFDTKRKDFWQMFIHHCSTILLLSASWVCNHVRLGTNVLVVHDLADAVLEAAKLAKYTNHMEACNVLFIAFAVTWIVTRLGIYPGWIMYNAFYDGTKDAYYFSFMCFGAFLSVLLFLHVYWSYLILCIVFKCVEGEALDDIRSSSEGGHDDNGIGDGDSASVKETQATQKALKHLKADPGGDMACRKAKQTS